MAELTLPDGTKVTNVPEGFTAAMVMQRLAAKRSADPAFFKVAGRAGLASLIDNLMGAVDIPLNIGARFLNEAVRPATNLADQARAAATGGRPSGFGPDLIQTPPLSQDFIMPTSNQVFGGAQVLGEQVAQTMTGSELPVTSFQEAQAQQQLITDVGQQENPIAAGTGDIAADALMLAGLRGTLRRPGAQQTIATERGLAQLEAARSADEARKLASVSLSNFANAPNMRRAMGALFDNSTGLKTLLNRSGRSFEAGLEGATIALLNGGDPLETAAYSAGGQAGGSLALSAISGLAGQGGLTSQGIRILGSAAGIAALIQLVKQVTPGGENFSLDSLESGFSKVLLGISLGALGGVAGAGRITDRFPVRALPAIADSITSLQRGATISVLNEILKDPVAETVVNQLRSDPNFFGARAGRQLQRAFMDEDISITETIDRLSAGKEFREALEGLR